MADAPERKSSYKKVALWVLGIVSLSLATWLSGLFGALLPDPGELAQSILGRERCYLLVATTGGEEYRHKLCVTRRGDACDVEQIFIGADDLRLEVSDLACDRHGISYRGSYPDRDYSTTNRLTEVGDRLSGSFQDSSGQSGSLEATLIPSGD